MTTNSSSEKNLLKYLSARKGLLHIACDPVVANKLLRKVRPVSRKETNNGPTHDYLGFQALAIRGPICFAAFSVHD